MSKRVRVAHLSGPTATIQNTPPLVTSNKARLKFGLPTCEAPVGAVQSPDALRPQSLAAPAIVYVEQFSAHPLERDAQSLYGPPDGWIDAEGAFCTERRAASDKPVYAIELHPDDGLYPLPYMARQSNGDAWDYEGVAETSPDSATRQTFYPDGSRCFEEIDRFGIDDKGRAGMVSAIADVDFHRVLPPAGYRCGQSDAKHETQAKEIRGKDFFPYKPLHLNAQPPRPALARVSNEVQRIVDDTAYDGAVWTQGTPSIEEIAYWFNLLIDTHKPIVCVAAQRLHGAVASDGAGNIIDALRYIASEQWRDKDGDNAAGVVLLQDQIIYAAREVAKVDARPGGYVATGGAGGILGQVTHSGRVIINFTPRYKFGPTSELCLRKLPRRVPRSYSDGTRLLCDEIDVKDGFGLLMETAVPLVSIVKDGGFSGFDWTDNTDDEADLRASIDHKLSSKLLAGFVVEGLTPHGGMSSAARATMMRTAVASGLPVVRVGRGNHEGFSEPHPYFISGSNLTATKARFLLMACLMKLGSLPIAVDPLRPTSMELHATEEAVGSYQRIFDSH